MRIGKSAFILLGSLALTACSSGEYFGVELAYDPIKAKDGTVVEDNWTVVDTFDVEAP
ncbi:hypothetical protein LR948_18510 [Roseivivax sp. GX 12232]|uniref:hypothetical protein n=1 Tax=Roseivivax sp. GX 12232 TaxID=2900547 RepID=UPI001E495A51|nr:hypothetical protein [Roseivivax sp. GX 12232]MCE0507354.1 hypothetical protein [Roseivivax sp. GX 12232]